VIADQVWVLKPQAPVCAVVVYVHGWAPLDAFIARYA
jgi:hypothetical protein